MADQTFHQTTNSLLIDLHHCSTVYALELLETKIDEAFNYGLSYIEFIYGTPDTYEGSIKKAFDDFLEGHHPKVYHHDNQYAGVIVSISNNSNPEPHDERMCFSELRPEYDKSFFKSYSYLYPLYPYREDYSVQRVSRQIGMREELIRKIAKAGYKGQSLPHAELRTVYDPILRRNETLWHITQSDVGVLQSFQNEIISTYKLHLQELGASQEESSEILQNLQSVAQEGKERTHAKTLLTRYRKKSQANLNNSSIEEH